MPFFTIDELFAEGEAYLPERDALKVQETKRKAGISSSQKRRIGVFMAHSFVFVGFYRL